jgi:hypothetical protein
MGQEDADGSTAKHAKWLLTCRFVSPVRLDAGLDGIEDGVEDAGVVAGQERQGHRQLLGVEGCQAGQALISPGAPSL